MSDESPNLFLRFVKPRAGWASVLIFVLLAGLVAAGLSGRLGAIETALNAPRFSFNIGDIRISAYNALRALVAASLVVWTTALIAGLVEGRLKRLTKVSPGTRSLVIKVFQIALYFVAFLVVLDVMGIDLTTLTVFSGALGIGLGFGLQKIASNFISGLILLAERSIEESDLIELDDGIFGFVRRTGARATLIETFDGKEILIPNEDFITNRVTNWTLTSSRGRVEIPVGVSYKSDFDLARRLMLEAATEHPRCIADPEPACFMTQFADSSVNFVLLFWVEDVTLGRREPQSDVMFAIARKFRDNGIVIPFPQRDLHFDAGASGSHGESAEE